MRATRTVVTPGRSNRVVGRIDSCLSGVIPPVEGNEPCGNQSGKFRVRVPPCVPLSHVPRTFAFRDHDFGFRETRFRFAELRRSRRRAFLSVPSVSGSHTTAPRQSPRRTARERGARTGERVRAAGARGAREARQGVRVGGLDPADRDPSRAGHVVAALSAVSGRASRLLLTATGAHPTPTSRDGEGQVQPQDRGAGQGHDQGDAQRDGTRGGGSGRDRGDRAIGEEKKRPTRGRRELGRGRGRGREHRERHVERDAT